MVGLVTRYNLVRKVNRVTFHLFLIAFIILIPAIIAKDIIFIIILSLTFLVSLIIYIITKSKLNAFLEKYKTICPICGDKLTLKEEDRYYINGIATDKLNFDTSIENDKKLEKIKLYICEKDNYEYYEIETYILKNNNLKLLNKKRGIKY